jgi:hypothetical protein
VLDTRANLIISEHVECQRAVVSLDEVIASGRQALDFYAPGFVRVDPFAPLIGNLYALSLKRVDPFTPLIDEPFERFPLGGPALVRGNVPALTGVFNLVRQLDERQALKSTESEDVPEAPPTVTVDADLTVIQDQT